MSDLGGTIISLWLGAVMLWCLLKYAPIEIKLRLKGRPFLCVVVWLCLSVGVLMGGGKCFQFVPPMTDREGQSTAEGDSVLVQWDTDKMPSDASVFIYRQDGTNEPVEVATSNVGQGWYRFTQPNATNYKYIVWTDYIPPPTEVTNEVYVVNGIARNEQGDYVLYVPKILNGNLPLGYTECEYLEGTGTQWIDTGVVPAEPIGIKAKFALTSTSDNRTKFVTHIGFSSGHKYGISCPWGNLYIERGLNAQYNGENAVRSPVGAWHVVSNNFMDDDKGILNDMVVASNLYWRARTDMLGLTFPLFAEIFVQGATPRLTASTIAPRIAYVQFTEGQELIRDFVPALDRSGRPCMYDKVTKQPFYNQGEGEFLYKIKEVQ